MRGLCPTRRQKILISSWGLNPANWLVVRTMPGEVHIEHRLSGKVRVVRERVGQDKHPA